MPEKVLKGLKICRDFDGEKCPECPYYTEEECLTMIADDALKLIAEQNTVKHALKVLQANGWKEDRLHEVNVGNLPNTNPHWKRQRCECGQMILGWKYCPECGKKLIYCD